VLVASRPAAGLILLLTACARKPEAAGSGPEPTAAGAAPEGRTGTSVRTTHFELRASAPRDCSAVPRGARADDVRRIGIDVTLTPLGELQVPANPYYARLVDERGNVHEATLGGCGKALGPHLPARGEVASGMIVFDVPRASRAFTLTYAPALVGLATEEIEVALGR
jgi:hypothetical protein